MNPKTFFGELKRRNVYKVATVYLVSAWLLIQLAITFLPLADAPAWLMPAFVVFLMFGFAAILFISWAFEATPDGLKRTETISPDMVLPSWSPRKFALLIIAIAALAGGLLVFDLLRRAPGSVQTIAAPETTDNP